MWKTIILAAAVVSCGGTDKSEPSTPQGNGSEIDRLIEQAVATSFRVDKAEHCNFFHGLTEEKMAENLRYEVAQGKDNDQEKKKEYGLKCIVDATTCDDLKQCANMMD